VSSNLSKLFALLIYINGTQNFINK